MANLTTDPKEALIADGRLYDRPIDHYGIPTILTMDLEFATGQIVEKMTAIYSGDHRIHERYGGYNPTINGRINGGIVAVANYAAGQIYNKLRGNLERYAPAARTARMNTRCPVAANQEFPTWLSATISSLAPLRITDGPTDRMVLYATTAATMQTYGRDAATPLNYGDYDNFISVLKESGVHMAPVDHQNVVGSYFPTIECHAGHNTYTLYGTVHQTHYENEDCIRIALFTNALGRTPFEKIGMTVGYIDDATIMTAIAALPAPDDIPIGETAISRGRPLAATYNVNYYGIQPEVPAQGEVPAKPRGMYVIGRGVTRRYQHILAREIAMSEVFQMLAFRLFH